MSKPGQVWLFVCFPCLLLDRLQRGEKQAPPRVLLDPKTHKACQLNAAATSVGMRQGMSLATLLALNDQVDIQLYSAERELTALKELADCSYDFAARIALRPPAGLLLEIGSMLRLFGNLPSYVSQLQLALQRQGVQLQLACGVTPMMAEVLARAGQEVTTQCASRLQQALQQLPLSRCGLAESILRKLQGIGIFRLQQLLALPRAEVRRRLGAELAGWLQALQQAQLSPTEYYQPPECFQRHLELTFEAQQISALLFPVKRLLAEMEAFLCQRQRQLQELDLILCHREQPETHVKIAAALPEYRASEWLTLIQYQLEKVQLSAPVLELRLLGKELLEQDPIATDLFHQGTDRVRSSQVLLGRLIAKLGSRRVFGLSECDDHRPELASRRCFPGDAEALMTHLPDLRPYWLLPEPLALTEQVVILRGPERISTGWWDGQAIRRDYFLAQECQAQEPSAQQRPATEPLAQDTTGKMSQAKQARLQPLQTAQTNNRLGRLCWVFRDEQGRWFLHGWFG